MMLKTGFTHGVLLLASAALLLVSLASSGADQKPAEKFVPGIELPQGNGRSLVETACTKCHDLAGLKAYQGYWNRAQWQAMVDTMVKNGAELSEAQKPVVVDYLTTFFGPGTRD